MAPRGGAAAFACGNRYEASEGLAAWLAAAHEPVRFGVGDYRKHGDAAARHITWHQPPEREMLYLLA